MHFSGKRAQSLYQRHLEPRKVEQVWAWEIGVILAIKKKAGKKSIYVWFLWETDSWTKTLRIVGTH